MKHYNYKDKKKLHNDKKYLKYHVSLTPFTHWQATRNSSSGLKQFVLQRGSQA